MPARNPPKNGRPWTPAKVRERLRTSMIVDRLEKQALSELPQDMTKAQRDAAKFLVSLVIPRAEAPKQIDLTANVNFTVVTGVP